MHVRTVEERRFSASVIRQATTRASASATAFCEEKAKRHRPNVQRLADITAAPLLPSPNSNEKSIETRVHYF